MQKKVFGLELLNTLLFLVSQVIQQSVAAPIKWLCLFRPWIKHKMV